MFVSARTNWSFAMLPRTRLLYASLLFAVLWTTGMYWWNRPTGTAGIVSLLVAGAVTGVLWYWGMRLWMRWTSRANG
jgi:hypothetical protein